MPLSHILLAIAMTVGWGGNFVAVRFGVQELSPIFLAALRFVILLACLLPWLRWKAGSMKPVLWAAVLGGPSHFAAIFLGTALLDHASSASFLSQLLVPISMIFAVVFLHELIGKWRLLGVGISLVGVLVLSFDPGVFSNLDGAALVIWAQISYAASSIFLRQVRNVSLLEMQAWTAALSAPILLGMSFLFEQDQVAQLQGMTSTGMGALAYSIIGASIVGHGGAYFLYQRHTVTTVMPFLLLIPVFATLGGYLLLEEELTMRMLIGGVIISSGVGLVIFREKRRAEASLGKTGSGRSSGQTP